MPTRPVSIETLRLIAAVRDALAEHLGADATVAIGAHPPAADADPSVGGVSP